MSETMQTALLWANPILLLLTLVYGAGKLRTRFGQVETGLSKVKADMTALRKDFLAELGALRQEVKTLGESVAFIQGWIRQNGRT